MNLNTIENYIITTLTTDVSGVLVKAWPNNPSEYLKEFSAPKGALLVRYNGSNYTLPDPNSQKVLIQDRDMEWVVTIFMRNAFGHDATGVYADGIYTLIEAVRSSLSGNTTTGLTDLTVFYPLRDGFVDEINGVWIYEMAFGVIGPETE